MTLKKPDPQILAVWRIRLLGGAVAPSFLSAYLFPHANWAWWVFTCAWASIFLYFYIWFFPILYRKLSYAVNRQSLLLHCGVVYTRVKAAPLCSIQSISLISTPLERLFGLCTLAVYAAGAVVRIPGLPREEARALRALLVLRGEGGRTDE